MLDLDANVKSIVNVFMYFDHASTGKAHNDSSGLCEGNYRV